MFYGNLHLPPSYDSLIANPIFLDAFSWIRQMPTDQAPGIYEIDGKDVFVNVHGYETLPREECRFESHREYLDIQYCIEGGEFIDIAWSSRLTPDGDFDPDKDLQFYSASPDKSGVKVPSPVTTLHMTPGDFAIFFPEDAHRPKVHDGQSSSVRKLVVKVNRRLAGGH